MNEKTVGIEQKGHSSLVVIFRNDLLIAIVILILFWVIGIYP